MEMQVITDLALKSTDLTYVAQCRVKLANARVEALQELWEQRAKALVPKDSQWTELDRRTMLEGFSAEIEKNYQLLVVLEEIVGDYFRSLALGGRD